jgi:hypothetical protein
MAITIHDEEGSVRLVEATQTAMASDAAVQRMRTAARCDALTTLRDALDASDEGKKTYRAEQKHRGSSAPSLRTPEDAGNQHDL